MKKLLLLALIALAPLSASAYPGCGPDIIIGGQVWASCNSLSNGIGSQVRSGWFLYRERLPLFISVNEFGKLSTTRYRRMIDRDHGPCAKGYALPNRGDWETALTYAELGNTSITSLLHLPRNGGYDFWREGNRIEPIMRTQVLGSYWSSSIEEIYGEMEPIIFEIRSDRYLPQYTTDDTDPAGEQTEIRQTGMGDLANVRCMRK